MKFENNGGSKKYKVKAIHDNAVHTSKLEDYLLDFYYLVS